MPTYKVSKAAAEDLFKIGLYTEEKWGVQQRNIYLDELERKFNELARNPDLPTSVSRDEIKIGCYSILINKHMIIYRKFDYGVRIVRVLHQSMDVKRHL